MDQAAKKQALRCASCGGKLEIGYGWRGMTLRCRDCRREELIGAHLDEIDEQTWERIASRRCDRV